MCEEDTGYCDWKLSLAHIYYIIHPQSAQTNASYQ